MDMNRDSARAVLADHATNIAEDTTTPVAREIVRYGLS